MCFFVCPMWTALLLQQRHLNPSLPRLSLGVQCGWGPNHLILILLFWSPTKHSEQAVVSKGKKRKRTIASSVDTSPLASISNSGCVWISAMDTLQQHSKPFVSRSEQKSYALRKTSVAHNLLWKTRQRRHFLHIIPIRVQLSESIWCSEILQLLTLSLFVFCKVLKREHMKEIEVWNEHSGFILLGNIPWTRASIWFSVQFQHYLPRPSDACPLLLFLGLPLRSSLLKNI